MKKLKLKKQNPTDQHSQRGNEEYNSNQSVPSARAVVKDWPGQETYEAEGAMFELLEPYCLPTTRKGPRLPALQLRPSVAEALVENDGRLELTDIADAMSDSLERKVRNEAHR